MSLSKNKQTSGPKFQMGVVSHTALFYAMLTLLERKLYEIFTRPLHIHMTEEKTIFPHSVVVYNVLFTVLLCIIV